MMQLRLPIRVPWPPETLEDIAQLSRCRPGDIVRLTVPNRTHQRGWMRKGMEWEVRHATLSTESFCALSSIALYRTDGELLRMKPCKDAFMEDGVLEWPRLPFPIDEWHDGAWAHLPLQMVGTGRRGILMLRPNFGSVENRIQLQLIGTGHPCDLESIDTPHELLELAGAAK